MSLKKVVENLPGYNKLVLPWHWLQAVHASRRYHHPAKRLRVIAVTGTNGKTTTCFMIWKMLVETGYKAGLLTTVGWSEDGETIHRQYEHMTTERVDILNQRMRAVADAGSDFLVLEVTSHALAQYRTWGVPIEVAVFTNLTHEHLDYHGNMKNYRKAKLKLFKKAEFGVVNADDKNANYFVNACGAEHVMTYGIDRGDIRATDIQLNSFGVDYTCVDASLLRTRAKTSAAKVDAPAKSNLTIETQIPGRFNVYNSLAAVAVGKHLGLKNDQIENGIHALESVEGRMSRIDEGQDFGVIVDYAHTPDALEKVFASVQSSLERQAAELAKQRSKPTEPLIIPAQLPEMKAATVKAPKKPRAKSKAAEPNQPTGRVISVHGGAGRRDESTRSMRGRILGKYSDIVIITEDDSRDEDPRKIAEQIVEGVENSGKLMGRDLFTELNRKEAIRLAFQMAEPGDLVLILGKGHEKTILRADGPHKFEDVKVATELLRELKSKNN